MTREGDGRAARREETVGRVVGRRAADPDADGDAAGVGHLRGEGPLPDQRVEGELLAVAEFPGHRLRRAERRGRSDRLVGLLGVLRLGRVLLRSVGEIRLAVPVGDGRARRREGLVGENDVVGPHVGDEALLVEALGEAHDLRGGQAESTAGLLLQGRGHEGGLGGGAIGLLLDGADVHGGRGEAVRETSGLGLVDDAHPLVGGPRRVEVAAGGHPITVDLDQTGGEGRARRGEQFEIPVGGGHEGHPLALPLDDESDGGALDAARGETAVHLPPQDRRDLVPVEAVEDAPCLSGVDQPVVDAARVLDGVVDRGSGDLVEHHPSHRDLGLQVLEEVPTDRLPLAVLIGGEIELAGLLEGGPQFTDHLAAALGQLVGRLEPVVDIDSEALGGEIGDVAHRGAHIELIPEEPGDGLRLGR